MSIDNISEEIKSIDTATNNPPAKYQGPKEVIVKEQSDSEEISASR